MWVSSHFTSLWSSVLPARARTFCCPLVVKMNSFNPNRLAATVHVNLYSAMDGSARETLARSRGAFPEGPPRRQSVCLSVCVFDLLRIYWSSLDLQRMAGCHLGLFGTLEENLAEAEREREGGRESSK